MTETTPAAEPKGVVFQCQRCGQDMPPMSDDLAKLARSTAGVTLAHEVCPGEEPPPKATRRFEVRCKIVEIVTRTDQRGEKSDGDVELVAFASRVEADNLDAAMRPLAEKLGEKWMNAEKQAHIADGSAS